MSPPIIPHSRPFTGAAEFRAVLPLIRAGKLATGETVHELEREMAGVSGMPHTVALNSGTSALHLALLVLNIGKGDRVIIPEYACSALLYAVLLAGAKPVFARMETNSPNLSYEKVNRCITPKVKAIIIPHLFGIAQDLAPFRKFGIPIIEDCAQAFGFSINGKPVGSMGDISVFSFYATKLVAGGEGGLLATRNYKWASLARDLREYDEKPADRLRFNYRLSDIHAALALSQLKRLPGFIARRKQIAGRYIKALSDSRYLPFAACAHNIYFRFILTGPDKAEHLISCFEKSGIRARKPIFGPLSASNRNNGRLASHAVSVPLYPALKEKEIRRIENILRKLPTMKACP